TITGKPVSVTAGVVTPNINMALDPGGRIAGRVTSGGVAVADVEIDIFSSGGTFLTAAITGSDGTSVTGEGLPPVSAPLGYFVVTDNSAGLIDQLYDPAHPSFSGATGNECGFTCAVTTGTALHVTGTATTSGIDFNLRPGGRISGAV